MPQLQPLLREINGFTRDIARDRLARGMVWDLADYIPQFADAPLRVRDGWGWQSNVLPAAAQGLIFAPFKAGDRLLAALDSGAVADVSINTVGHTIITPTVPATRQNPVFYNDNAYVFHKDGTSLPVGISWTGSAFTGVALPASAATGRYGTVYRDRLVSAAPASNDRLIAFAKPSNPVTAWEPKSVQVTSQPITGIASMRNALLIFHKGSMERLRGATPPDPALSDPTGDMQIEPMWDRAGCFDARSIAYWNDNCLFADERGVHITDGGIVRNLVAQGGIQSLWRTAFQNAVSVAGASFLDFYIVCIRTSDKPPLTLICDIPDRQWFRFTNIDVTCMTTSVGFFDRLWGGSAAHTRVTALSQMFFPNAATISQDADLDYVLPVIETGWFRFGAEARKRLKSLYLSYDVRLSGNAKTTALSVGYIDSPEETSFRNARRSLNGTVEYTRRRVPISLGAYGAAFRFAQTVPSLDNRIYDLSAQAWSQEDGYL